MKSSFATIPSTARAFWRAGFAIASLLVFASSPNAGQVSLAWDASADSRVTGYVVSYGASSGSYPQSINVGNRLAYTVPSLPDGSTSYFVVQAYDGSGTRSGYSNEVRATVAGAAPSASFTATPSSGVAPLTVAFSSASSGTITSYAWDYGDGTSGSAANSIHTYTVPGTYAVRLTASGPGGSNTSAPSTITVTASSSSGSALNASFELPGVGSGYRYNPTGNGVAWTFYGPSGVQGNGSAWGAATAPAGTQTAFLKKLGAIYQTVTLAAGNYVLSFKVARRAYSVPPGAVQPIRVKVNNQHVSLVTPPGTTFTSVAVPFSVTTSGPQVLRLESTNMSVDATTFVDMVAIAPGLPSLNIAVGNSGFEAPALASGYQYNPTGSGVGWTFTGTSGVQHNGSAWGAPVAPEGSQTGFVQNLGAIAQAITLPAGSYTLRFKAARRSYANPTGALQSIRVTLGGSPIGSLVTPTSTAFTNYAIPFSVSSSGARVLKLEGMTSAGHASVFIDAVAIESASGT